MQHRDDALKTACFQIFKISSTSNMRMARLSSLTASWTLGTRNHNDHLNQLLIYRTYNLKSPENEQERPIQLVERQYAVGSISYDAGRIRRSQARPGDAYTEPDIRSVMVTLPITMLSLTSLAPAQQHMDPVISCRGSRWICSTWT